MSSKIVFVIKLPDPSAPDVVSRKVTAVLNGLETLCDGTISPETSTLGPFTGRDNDRIDVTLVDIDDAGNLSPVRGVQFVLHDTIPPPMPGQPALSVIAEVADEAPAVAEPSVVAEAAVEVDIPTLVAEEEPPVVAEVTAEEVSPSVNEAEEGPATGLESVSEPVDVSEVVEERKEAVESESEAISEATEEPEDAASGSDEEAEKQDG